MRADEPRCDDIRVSLSARLDGEPTPLHSGLVDAHVRTCLTCQAWLDGAERVTRAVRVQPVEVPDLTARILAALHADAAMPGASRRTPSPVRTAGGWVARQRFGLGALAVLQFMLSIPALLGAAGHDAHTAREVAALEIALSVGLLVTAFYPEYARVFAPVAVTLVVCFATIGALDTIEGAVAPSRLAVHLLTLAQTVIVWQIARAHGRGSVARATP